MARSQPVIASAASVVYLVKLTLRLEGLGISVTGLRVKVYGSRVKGSRVKGLGVRV